MLVNRGQVATPPPTPPTPTSPTLTALPRRWAALRPTRSEVPSHPTRRQAAFVRERASRRQAAFVQERASRRQAAFVQERASRRQAAFVHERASRRQAAFVRERASRRQAAFVRERASRRVRASHRLTAWVAGACPKLRMLKVPSHPTRRPSRRPGHSSATPLSSAKEPRGTSMGCWGVSEAPHAVPICRSGLRHATFVHRSTPKPVSESSHRAPIGFTHPIHSLTVPARLRGRDAFRCFDRAGPGGTGRRRRRIWAGCRSGPATSRGAGWSAGSGPPRPTSPPPPPTMRRPPPPQQPTRRPPPRRRRRRRRWPAGGG
jgi:hypothetical protein